MSAEGPPDEYACQARKALPDQASHVPSRHPLDPLSNPLIRTRAPASATGPVRMRSVCREHLRLVANIVTPPSRDPRQRARGRRSRRCGRWARAVRLCFTLEQKSNCSAPRRGLQKAESEVDLSSIPNHAARKRAAVHPLEMAHHLRLVKQPLKLPVVLTQDEVLLLLEAAPGPKYKAALGVACGARLDAGARPQDPEHGAEVHGRRAKKAPRDRTRSLRRANAAGVR